MMTLTTPAKVELASFQMESFIKNKIPYARMVDAETVETKSGHLLQVIKVEGLVAETLNDSDIQHEKDIRNTLLKSLTDSSFALYFHTIRKRYQNWLNDTHENAFIQSLASKWQARLQEKQLYVEACTVNAIFLKQLIHGDWRGAKEAFYQTGIDYVLGFSLLVASIFSLLGHLPKRYHVQALRDVEKGKINHQHEVSDKVIRSACQKIKKYSFDGTLLGISKYTGAPVILPDKLINQIVMVLGTTGSGKTITLRRFYRRAIENRFPLIIVDGKPDIENITWIRQLAEQFNRPFLGFNCENFLSYNCLAHGGYTELKDKIICLKDEWQSEYYRSIAEDYLQTTFEVLLRSNQPFDLKRVTDCLEYSELVILARHIADKALMEKVAKLNLYELKDISGLQAHLNLLIHSELGQYFQQNEQAFNLKQAIDDDAIVYFALPALQFPSFAKVLGKLVINDLKTVICQTQHKKIFTCFDEFSVFAGEQVLNLVNMGRGKGVHAIFGTQGMADLKRVDPLFAEQILNCVNTFICHRINDPASAQSIADWIGTQNVFAVTAQLDMTQPTSGVGSIRSTKEYLIHPDSIKQELKTGEVFYFSKLGNMKKDKIKVILD